MFIELSAFGRTSCLALQCVQVLFKVRGSCWSLDTLLLCQTRSAKPLLMKDANGARLHLPWDTRGTTQHVPHQPMAVAVQPKVRNPKQSDNSAAQHP